jgi:transcriptional regulator with XRE-family HTH domain
MRGSVATLHSEEYQRFLTEIRAMRASAGLTQAALAVQLGKPPSYVAKSELGERRLDVLEMLAWCRACDSDPLAFLKRIIRAVDEANRKT